nr:insulinase family protein [Bacteroides propionicifaciens]
MKVSLMAAFILLGSLQLYAQQSMPIPQDPKVRIGKLDNGLTYYIRKNAQPAERADFYIAQKVGAIQENPDQRGLAHFLEHMAFNGTTHFPGDQLKQYLESIGVKFGENLNAYTAIDETVYNISNVPVSREGALDSCLLILHDWANDLSLEDKEIDKERGVITEEWRSRMSAGQRYIENLLPKFFEGTKYDDSLPIGSMEVVNNFKYQTLRDYYETWYRPDLQGIMIVGDIDVDQVESKIKAMFSDIPAQPQAVERVYYPVNDNDEPLVFTFQDKEQTNIVFSYYNKYAPFPKEAKGDLAYLQVNYAINMISSMLNARLNEISEQANPPFIYAGVYDGDFIVAKTKKAFTGVVVCKEDNIEGGIKILLSEIERVRQHGFTPGEYARARASYLSGLESAFNERDKVKNAAYVNEYVRHFLDNEPAPGIEFEYGTMSQLANVITVDHINQMMPMLISENNKALTLLAPEKEGLNIPSPEALASLLEGTMSEKFAAYEDHVSDEPLISKEPVGGKVVKEEKNGLYDATTLTLSNGVKVVIKPTDFKADQIIMSGYSYGGNSVFPDDEYTNFKSINEFALVGGLGSFSKVELDKVLAGKIASVSTSVNYLTESVNGYSSPKDFETLMQLTYLNFTAPRKDVDAFESNISRSKAAMLNNELNPASAFNDSITKAIYGDNLRAKRLHANDLDKISYDRVLEMYNDRFKDASDFTFIFVGNIDLETARPLLEKYLGGLPTLDRKENYIDRKLYDRKGEFENEFIRQQDNPKASILTYYNGNVKYTAKNNLLMNMLSQVMTLVYTEKVREDEGGTYGVGVQAGLNNLPKQTGTFLIVFDTAPEKKDRLMEIIYRELDKVAKEGPSEKDLSKVKENMIKKYHEQVKENAYWSSMIQNQLTSGIDLNADFENLVNSIGIKDIQKFTKAFLKQGNKAEVIMISPEQK